MGDMLFPSTLFSGRAVNGQASAVPTAIDLRFCTRAESLMLRANKTGTSGAIKVQYAISRDGSTVDGSYTANASIVTSTRDDFPANTSGWNVVALPNFLTPFVFLKFKGATHNPATGVTVDAVLFKREEV